MTSCVSRRRDAYNWAREFALPFTDPSPPVTLRPGDHICSIYDNDDQLVETVAAFLADGLRRGERCWYVPTGRETLPIRLAMERLGVDTETQAARSALHILDTWSTALC